MTAEPSLTSLMQRARILQTIGNMLIERGQSIERCWSLNLCLCITSMTINGMGLLGWNVLALGRCVALLSLLTTVGLALIMRTNTRRLRAVSAELQNLTIEIKSRTRQCSP